MILACQNLTKRFGAGRTTQIALDNVSLEFNRGQTCLLLGPSGSGKTTLLSILGCILSPSEGALFIDGKRVDHRRKGTVAALRRKYIGFVFQHSNLLPFLSVRDNLAVVGRNAGIRRRSLGSRITTVLEALRVAELRHKLPEQLSGGERQRVAIGRALLHAPPIILADEPTAALDWANGQNAVDLLTNQAKVANALLIAVTHDTRLIDRFDRVLRVESGHIVDA